MRGTKTQKGISNVEFIEEENDSYWCKGTIKVANCLVKLPKLDFAMSIIIAGSSGAIAFKQPFLPHLLGKTGGMMTAVGSNFIANTAIFFDFRLSDGLARSIKAERKLRQLHPCLSFPLMTMWYISTFLCLPGGMMAQACLTGENLPNIASQVCFALGALGFLATRGATISRWILHFSPEINSDSLQPAAIRILERFLPIGSRSHLSWDKKLVDVLSGLATAGFMTGGWWIWTEMYRLKLIKGLADLGFDICFGQDCFDSPAFYITAFLSNLSYFYFYFPASDALGHLWSFITTLNDYLVKKGCSKWLTSAPILLCVALIIFCGLGSESGLVASRAKVDETLAQVYFLFVNTPSLLKFIAEKLKEQINKIEAPELMRPPSTAFSIQDVAARPASIVRVLSNEQIQRSYEILDDEVPEKRNSWCCNFFSAWSRIKKSCCGDDSSASVPLNPKFPV